MGLNYTDGCVNFRDFGGYVNLILGEHRLAEGLLLRGGSIDHIKDIGEIGHARSAINLRKREDFHEFGISYYHFPMFNKVEKYDTSQKSVQRWLNDILKVFEEESLQYPVLIHCLSGKDRTGIVVAALLLILGIGEATIIKEYLLSEGEVSQELIQLSLEGMRDVERYFSKVDLEKVRSNIQGLGR